MSLNAKLIELFPQQPQVNPCLPDDELLTNLFADNPSRLAHMYSCQEVADELGLALKLPAKEALRLSQSAAWHDIGRASALNKYNYHALDGAIFLAHAGVDEQVVEAVLRHSQADIKALSIPELAPYYSQFKPSSEAAWLCEAVSWCDWRGSSLGHRVSAAQRLQNIIEQNPGRPGKHKRASAMCPAAKGWGLNQLIQVGKVHVSPLPWLFIDIDSTLITPGTSLSSINRQALENYLQAGGQISLATGKHPLSIKPLVDSLPTMPGHIAVNGAVMVVDDQAQRIGGLGKVAEKISKHLEQIGIAHIIYLPEKLIARGPVTSTHIGYYRAVSEFIFEQGEISNWSEVLKILCFIDPSENKEQSVREMAIKTNTDCHRSGSHFIEFMQKGHGKGQGLQKLTALYDFPALHTLSIGDNENDASMFSVAGMSAAVGNAALNVQEQADFILPACEQNGVAALIDMLLEGPGWAGLQAALQKES